MLAILLGFMAPLLLLGTASASPRPADNPSDLLNEKASELIGRVEPFRLEGDRYVASSQTARTELIAEGVRVVYDIPEREAGVEILVRPGGSDLKWVVDQSGIAAANDVSTTYVAAANEAGTSVAAVIHEPPATSDDLEVYFDLDLPADVTLTPEGEVIDIVLGQHSAGQIEAPWAVDATGRILDTVYELDGTRLIQHVAIDNQVEFPVVADPKFTWGYISGTIYFTWQETLIIANATAAVTVCSTAVAIPIPPLAAAWAAQCVIGWVWMTATANAAKEQGMCLKVKLQIGSSHPGTYPVSDPNHGSTCKGPSGSMPGK